MSYSVPLTATSNSALTAAQWNASVRDNILETAPAKATAAGQLFVATGTNAIAARTPTGQTINTAENTTSGSFTDLTTLGPQVSVTCGSSVIVLMSGSLSNSGANNTYMAYAVSGATTIAAADNTGMSLLGSVGGRISFAKWVSGLTPGTNVFTAKYRTSAGTATFSDRVLGIIPL